MHLFARARYLLRPILLMASVIGCFAASAPAAQVQLPAVTVPTTQEHHVGKAIFFELVTPNLAAAKSFYGNLFGWTFRDIDSRRRPYAEVLLGDQPIAGMVQRPSPRGESRQPAWLTYFAVEDVDRATQTAVQQGAKVLYQPHSLADRGREAVLADPQGAVFALLASSSGDPPDVLVDPGAWIWSSLITRDAPAAAAFYRTVFGYEIFNTPTESGRQHFMLASGGYARASVNPPPTNHPDMYPHWLNYVRVDDVAATAAKVVALGGRVLVEPRPSRGGGKIALAADPFGAPFGLLEWRNDKNTSSAR